MKSIYWKACRSIRFWYTCSHCPLEWMLLNLIGPSFISREYFLGHCPRSQAGDLLQTPLPAPRAPIWLPSLIVLNQSQYILHTQKNPPRGCWSSCLFYIKEQTTPNNGGCKCSKQHPTMGDVNATKISSLLVRGHFDRWRAGACWYMRGHSEPRGEWRKGRMKHGKRLNGQLSSVTNRILNFDSSSSKCWYQKEEEGKAWKTEEPAVLWGGGGSLSANTMEFCGIF